MRLRDLFPLLVRETRVSDDECRAMLAAFDSGVGTRVGHHGMSGAKVFLGSDDTVWKVDPGYALRSSERLVGVRTKTLVPILQVVRLSSGEHAVQSPRMRALSSPEYHRLMSVTTGADVDLSGFTPAMIDDAVDPDPRAAEFIRTLYQELCQWGYGAERGEAGPIDLYGEENVMADRDGTWRYVDLG
jgi:hypothetical protein